MIDQELKDKAEQMFYDLLDVEFENTDLLLALRHLLWVMSQEVEEELGFDE